MTYPATMAESKTSVVPDVPAALHASATKGHKAISAETEAVAKYLYAQCLNALERKVFPALISAVHLTDDAYGPPKMRDMDFEGVRIVIKKLEAAGYRVVWSTAREHGCTIWGEKYTYDLPCLEIQNPHNDKL